MQTSDTSSTTGNIFYVFTTLLCGALCSVWLMQKSINAYVEQTYHITSPLSVLNAYPLWQKGGELSDFLYAQKDMASQNIDAQNTLVVKQFNDEYAFTPEYLKAKEQAYIAAIEAKKRKAELAKQDAENAKKARYTLQANGQNQVLFAGDSMMQGVAPFVQKALQSQGISSVNLSKQSTGLAYPSLFDWPNTIKNTLTQNPNITMLMVFLGPNDPWDMPSQIHKGKYLTFGTPEWDDEYRSRVAGIIDDAHAKGVSVVWLTTPNMRKEKLNTQIRHLNEIIKNTVLEKDALWLDTHAIFGETDSVYKPQIIEQGKPVKMRTDDGIHFTVPGQKAISEHILKNIYIE